MKRLQDKIALVTGGAAGIGLETARLFLSEGAKVALLADQKIGDLDRVIAVNVRGAFLGLQHVMAVLMAQKSGNIINMSSIAGLKGSSKMAPYITSKHAVVGLTRAAAIEAAPRQVRVNSVHPSPVNTRIMRALEDGFSRGRGDAVKEQFTASIPLGRYRESADVAALALFLASAETAIVYGAQYPVDGCRLSTAQRDPADDH